MIEKLERSKLNLLNKFERLEKDRFELNKVKGNLMYKIKYM